MTAAGDVLDVARTQLGTAESPSGSNNVAYNTWYYGRAVSGSAYPWCAVFVSWVADRAGATAIIPKHAYTPSGAAWFQSRGQWSRTPKVGSIVYYQWAGMSRISHVGIVEAVNSDGSWIAIEGNTDGAGSRTGGRVMRQRRSSLGALGGFGHPRYDSAKIAEAVTAAPAPAAEPASAPGAPAFPGRELSEGMKGEDVRTAQGGLNRHAGNLGRTPLKTDSNGRTDGDFGPLTYKMLQAYQRARGGPPFNLDDDGIIGPLTWRSLWQ